MNSFYIPALAGQIYAMPGMETKLHAVMNKPGDYEGFSANYSGAGFSGMHFKFRAVAADGFRRLGRATSKNGGVAGPRSLSCAGAPERERAAAHLRIRRLRAVRRGRQPVRRPRQDVPQRDDGDRRQGRPRPRPARNVLALEYDKCRRRGSLFGPVPTGLASLCADPKIAQTPQSAAPRMASAPVRGLGLPKPSLVQDVAAPRRRCSPAIPPIPDQVTRLWKIRSFTLCSAG